MMLELRELRKEYKLNLNNLTDEKISEWETKYGGKQNYLYSSTMTSDNKVKLKYNDG